MRLYALLGKLADLIARSLERHLLSWHPNHFRARHSGREAKGLSANPMPRSLSKTEGNGRRGEGMTLRRVTKRYGEREVLRSLDLEVRGGEFVAILGRSGCGKSTLLRLLCGIERPTTGSITWEGATHESVHVRMMFQDARLLPWKTVLENVRIGTTDGDPVAAQRALQLVGLADRGNDWPRTLSGGQKQRVALARALASEPKVLLLDEPFASLDALTRLEMQQWVENAWMRERFTVLLVTHDVPESVRLADRVITLEDGRIGGVDRVALARPRPPAHPVMATIERRLLDRLLQSTSMPPVHRQEDEINVLETEEETCPRLDAS
ncbi:MAG: ATP-binding cassette domain-containing protein [Planctomycetota bacterium]